MAAWNALYTFSPPSTPDPVGATNSVYNPSPLVPVAHAPQIVQVVEHADSVPQAACAPHFIQVPETPSDHCEQDDHCRLARLLIGSAPGGVQALLSDTSISECRRAWLLFKALGHVCRESGENAECLLICERRQLHGPEFAEFVHSQTNDDDGSALRRIRLKYVLPPAAAGDIPPLVTLLAGLQNLDFRPVVVAVLGLSQLTRSRKPPALPQHAIAGEAPPLGFGGLGGGGAPFGAALVEAQNLALATMLLVDVAAQATTLSGCPCRGLLWDTGVCLEAQLGLLGAALEGVWSASMGDVEDNESDAGEGGGGPIILEPLFGIASTPAC